jgi:predicted PurR-regulated permease PerM
MIKTKKGGVSERLPFIILAVLFFVVILIIAALWGPVIIEGAKQAISQTFFGRGG